MKPAVGNGVNHRVLDLKRFGGDLFAAGAFVTAEGSPATPIARGNGTSWSAMVSGPNARAAEPSRGTAMRWRCGESCA